MGQAAPLVDDDNRAMREYSRSKHGDVRIRDRLVTMGVE